MSDGEHSLHEKDSGSPPVDLIFSAACMTPEQSNYDTLSVDERLCSFETDARETTVEELHADCNSCTSLMYYTNNGSCQVDTTEGVQEVHNLQIQCQSSVDEDGNTETQSQIEWELLDPYVLRLSVIFVLNSAFIDLFSSNIFHHWKQSEVLLCLHYLLKQEDLLNTHLS